MKVGRSDGAEMHWTPTGDCQITGSQAGYSWCYGCLGYVGSTHTGGVRIKGDNTSRRVGGKLQGGLDGGTG